MALRLQIVNPLDYPEWDNWVISNNDYSFFHSSSWAQAICNSYHYTPLYFTLFDTDKFSASIPLMEVKSIITGKKGVALPFSDHCEPLTSDDKLIQSLLNGLFKYAKNRGWKYVEFRGNQNFFQNTVPSAYYYTHILDLRQNKGAIYSRFSNGTRRNIKKAIKEGVRVDFFNSLESVKHFYRLNCITRKRHGLPPQPYRFFKNIHQFVISDKKGFVVLAFHRKKIIAGAIYFHFGKKAIYKYGASDKKYRHLRANNLVMWYAIQWYSQQGYELFDMGRTQLSNKGLDRFKSGWGTERELLPYYTYDFKAGSFVERKTKNMMRWNFFLATCPYSYSGL